jgi:hypothetical protein
MQQYMFHDCQCHVFWFRSQKLTWHDTNGPTDVCIKLQNPLSNPLICNGLEASDGLMTDKGVSFISDLLTIAKLLVLTVMFSLPFLSRSRVTNNTLEDSSSHCATSWERPSHPPQQNPMYLKLKNTEHITLEVKA